jgi:hypothetical protein
MDGREDLTLGLPDRVIHPPLSGYGSFARASFRGARAGPVSSSPLMARRSGIEQAVGAIWC